MINLLRSSTQIMFLIGPVQFVIISFIIAMLGFLVSKRVGAIVAGIIAAYYSLPIALIGVLIWIFMLSDGGNVLYLFFQSYHLE